MYSCACLCALRPPVSLQRTHLDDVDLRVAVAPGLDVQRVCVVGDDEDYGGRAEGHPLLGPVRAAAGHHDGPDGPLLTGQRPLLDDVLETDQTRAEQLQQAPAKLQRQRKAGQK